VARCCPAADLVTWPWADGVACDIFCCGEGFSAGGRRKAEGRGEDDDVAINRMGPDTWGAVYGWVQNVSLLCQLTVGIVEWPGRHGVF